VELSGLKDYKGRRHGRAKHSSGLEANIFGLDEGFGLFPGDRLIAPAVLQTIDGLVPEVNSVSMVSDA
jgi:hypothetical protein